MSASTGEVPGRIFMTYRREDTAYPAAWLFDRLVGHFGRDQVFKDIDSIELGDDFVEVITAAVGSCDALLALIGDRWLSSTGRDGQRRLDDPDDFVRLEIEAALARNVRVIPILVEGAQMPRADELPASLAKLARRQALELSPARFDTDTRRLLMVLDRTIAQAKERARQDAEAAAERQRQVGQLQQRIRDRAAARDWDAVVAASGQLAGLDPAAADPDGLASMAREQIARRRQAEQAAAERRRVRQLQQRIRDRAAARDWDAVVAASGQLAGLDPAAADPDGLASVAREQIARRQEAEPPAARAQQPADDLLAWRGESPQANAGSQGLTPAGQAVAEPGAGVAPSPGVADHGAASEPGGGNPPWVAELAGRRSGPVADSWDSMSQPRAGPGPAYAPGSTGEQAAHAEVAECTPELERFQAGARDSRSMPADGGPTSAVDVPTAAVAGSTDPEAHPETVTSAATAVARGDIPAAAKAAGQSGETGTEGASGAAPEDPARPAAAGEGSTSTTGLLAADQNSRFDPGASYDVQPARRPRRRIAHRTSTRTAWILRHRLLVLPLAVVVLAAAGVAAFLLPGSPAGYAAFAGQQRITIATLDAEVANLSQAVERYKANVQLSQEQQTQQTLTWLVRFKINDELARQAGITVTTAQANAALAQTYAAAKAKAESRGIPNASLDLILAANGIPPNLADELGRYQAINNAFVKQANGGKSPTTSAEQTATGTKLQHAQCEAAKNLAIQINPQFGRMDYTQYQVVSASSTAPRTPGTNSTASASGLTPAC